jgi:agmatinase
MTLPFEYDHTAPLQFLGTRPVAPSFEEARVVVLPVPLERSTSYVPGTRFGPREILLASTQVELFDEEHGVDTHTVGVYTLPEMEFHEGDLGACVAHIRRVVSEIVERGKLPIVLGGEHSVTPAVVGAVAAAHANLSVLQIDAHSDLREQYQGSPHSHACAMRRSLEFAPAVQVGIRAMSEEERAALPSLQTRVFYDWNMRDDPAWMDAVVESLSDDVYITVDVDGMDPGIMPATGTPEPGGLTWPEMLGLMRRVFARRNVVGWDLVELSPNGTHAPNFLCARLIYKMLGYKFAREIRTA